MLLSKVLATTDFSEAADAAIRVAKDLARRYDAELSLLHVYEPGPAVQERLIPRGEVRHLDVASQARARLAKLAELHELGDVELHLDMDASPVEGILEHLRAHEIDLVVMAAHSHTALERLLVGSVTERVVRHACCAVMTVKPGQRPVR
ncbi:MAG: universal stress protein [Myxococcota bacterium]